MEGIENAALDMLFHVSVFISSVFLFKLFVFHFACSVWHFNLDTDDYGSYGGGQGEFSPLRSVCIHWTSVENALQCSLSLVESCLCLCTSVVF